MARVKTARITRKKHKKILKQAKGYFGSKHRLFKTAKEQEDKSLAKEISEYKNSHPNDVVVAVLHWGVEFQQSPSPKQRLQAQMLVSAGADVIVGHHPHVLQPKSQILGKPVFFSIGNFIFDQHAAIARRGALARIVIRPDTITSELREYDIIGCRPVIRK